MIRDCCKPPRGLDWKEYTCQTCGRFVSCDGRSVCYFPDPLGGDPGPDWEDIARMQAMCEYPEKRTGVFWR